MKEVNKTYAIALLIILIIIGGFVLYGDKENPKTNYTFKILKISPDNKNL